MVPGALPWLDCDGSVTLLVRPDIAIGHVAQDRGEQQEADPHEPGLVALLKLRLGSPNQERGDVLGHLVLGRFGAVAVGHQPVGRDRIGHRDVQRGKVGIVMHTFRGLGIGELLDQVSRLRGFIAGQQRVDVGRALMARFGNQRKIRRSALAGIDHRRELVRRQARTVLNLAGQRILGRDGRLGGNRLDLGLVVTDRREIAV